MSKEERWAAVPGYENAYAVSDRGRVMSLPRADSRGQRVDGRILKPGRNLKGYLHVNLCNDGKVRAHMVHRLVMLAFIGPCPAGMEVCHNNGNPADNRLGNLRYDTRKANAADRIKHGTHGLKLTADDVDEIRRLRACGLTQQVIAARFGISRMAISLILLGKRWAHTMPKRPLDLHIHPTPTEMIETIR